MQLIQKTVLSLFCSASGWKFSAAYFTVAAVLVAVPLRYSPSVRNRLKVPPNATIMASTTCSRHVSRVSCGVANSIFALILWCLLLLQDAVESNACCFLILNFRQYGCAVSVWSAGSLRPRCTLCDSFHTIPGQAVHFCVPSARPHVLLQLDDGAA